MKDLAQSSKVSNLLKKDSVLVEVDGSIRRITLDNLINSINEGNEELLRAVAWGVPLKQVSQSSPAYGRIGNLDMWEQYKSRTGRYLLKNNGKAAKLAKNSSAIFADGTELNESLGHVMVLAPDLYYRVVNTGSGDPYLWMSEIPIGGYLLKVPAIGAYKGSMSGTALVSRSGATLAGSKTIDAFWNAAQVNGVNFGLTDYNCRLWMTMMLLSEYGNTNSQAVLGNGVTGTNNTSDWETPVRNLKTGETKGLGDAFGSVPCNYTMASGTAVQGATHVSLMGIEDPYAWQWEMVQGIFCGKSENAAQNGSEVFIYSGNRMPSAAELASTPSGDFRQLTRPASDGFIRKMTVTDRFDIIPAEIGGGATSGWCDYFYQNKATGQLCLWGGNANNGSNAGLSYLNSNNAWSNSNANIGSRHTIGKITKNTLQTLTLHLVVQRRPEGRCQKISRGKAPLLAEEQVMLVGLHAVSKT